MNIAKSMRSGLLCAAVGLLPLLSSQAHAQVLPATTLLESNVMYVSVHASSNGADLNNMNDTLFADAYIGDTDVLITTPGSGTSRKSTSNSSNWLVGGALGVTAGVVGLMSGSSSAGSSVLRTPADPVGLLPSGLLNSSALAPGASPRSNSFLANAATTGSAVNSFSSPGGAPPSGSGGGFGIAAVTPEPGALALLAGLGLTISSFGARRRRRNVK